MDGCIILSGVRLSPFGTAATTGILVLLGATADPMTPAFRIRVTTSRIVTQSARVLALRVTACHGDRDGKHFGNHE
jgi:hypothetical protein